MFRTLEIDCVIFNTADAVLITLHPHHLWLQREMARGAHHLKATAPDECAGRWPHVLAVQCVNWILALVRTAGYSLFNSTQSVPGLYTERVSVEDCSTIIRSVADSLQPSRAVEFQHFYFSHIIVHQSDCLFLSLVWAGRSHIGHMSKINSCFSVEECWRVNREKITDSVVQTVTQIRRGT